MLQNTGVWKEYMSPCAYIDYNYLTPVPRDLTRSSSLCSHGMQIYMQAKCLYAFHKSKKLKQEFIEKVTQKEEADVVNVYMPVRMKEFLRT